MKNIVALFLMATLMGGTLQYRAHALAGDLNQPSLSFPTTMKDELRNQVMEAIKNKAYQFLGGRFINAFTTLRYGGDMKGLNLFLENLVACEGMTVVISYDQGLPGGGETWRLQHTAWGDARQLAVAINRSSPKFDEKQLKIPEEILSAGGVHKASTLLLNPADSIPQESESQ